MSKESEAIRQLARTVALLADAMAQHLDGSMSKNDAAANLHRLNSDAARVLRQLG